MPSPQRSEVDDLIYRADYSNYPTVYIGQASPGSADSSASWQIRRQTYDESDRLVAVLFACGCAERKYIWDQRTSCEYA